jgi:hypothetical protein
MTESKPPRKHAAEETAATGDAPQSPLSDPRHPDTTADQGVNPPDLDPENYGFRPIEVTDVDEQGPGTVPPVEVPAVSQGETFADRAAAREGGGNKAVQSSQSQSKAENK